MQFLKFVAALAAAALLHFAGARLLPHFSLAVDLFLLVVALEARHGSPLTGMFAGLAAGLLADGLSGGPYGLYGFADTAVGFGIALAAQQLVVQRTSSLAGVFAAAAAAQQAILAALALVFRDHAELPRSALAAGQGGDHGPLGRRLDRLRQRPLPPPQVPPRQPRHQDPAPGLSAARL